MHFSTDCDCTFRIYALLAYQRTLRQCGTAHCLATIRTVAAAATLLPWIEHASNRVNMLFHGNPQTFLGDKARSFPLIHTSWHTDSSANGRDGAPGDASHSPWFFTWQFHTIPDALAAGFLWCGKCTYCTKFSTQFGTCWRWIEFNIWPTKSLRREPPTPFSIDSFKISAWFGLTS